MTMKAPLAKLVPTLQRTAVEACESIALKHLGADVVRDLATTAALAGHLSWRVRLPDGPDLRRTATAKAFEKWAKYEGLEVEWLTRNGTTVDGRTVTVEEPEISWRVKS